MLTRFLPMKKCLKPGSWVKKNTENTESAKILPYPLQSLEIYAQLKHF